MSKRSTNSSNIQTQPKRKLIDVKNENDTEFLKRLSDAVICIRDPKYSTLMKNSDKIIQCLNNIQSKLVENIEKPKQITEGDIIVIENEIKDIIPLYNTKQQELQELNKLIGILEEMKQKLSKCGTDLQQLRDEHQQLKG
ncbi:hypothetical protein QTN25_003098 [Entamoeba marina]